METKKCPEHISTGVTPKDEECHSHGGDTQQRFHNIHCKLVGCDHSLSGKERHDDVPKKPARNRLEKLLEKLDRKKD